MKICFVSFEYPPNILGGEGTYALTIVNGLRRRGVDVYLITRGDRNDSDQKTFRVPTPSVRYWQRIFFRKAAVRLLHDLNKQLKFDLIHVNGPHISFGRFNLPTVCTIHSTRIKEIKLKLGNLGGLKGATDIADLILKNPVGAMFDVLVAREIDKIICPSPYLARELELHCLVDKEKICVVPNGINLEEFDEMPDDDNALSKYDLERDNYVLFMGRLTALKGVQYLIEAFEAIRKERVSLKLVIVGTGESERYLRNLAYGRKNVVFAGYIGSLRAKKLLYENCVAVAAPSLYEGLPMTILEAMACGKAVVASDVGGIPTLIRHGKNGFLTRPKDVKNLEKFIRILVEDANLRKSMGSFGRKLVEKEFTVDKMVDKTLKVYESL
jgi:glycosyltransferase involved in cell wall biosynthesis